MRADRLRRADAGEHRYYQVGIEHIAFRVDEREEVDQAYERCVATGARIHFPPELDRDVADYHAFFAFDADGIRVEIFAWDEA